MATTWRSTGSRSAKAVCTTGTESAPTLATEGMGFDSVGAFGVKAEADSGQTLSGAGNLLAYIYDDISGRWGRCPDLDLEVSVNGDRQQAWQGWQVVAPRGRVAYVPSGVTVSSGGVTIYLNASTPGGAWA